MPAQQQNEIKERGNPNPKARIAFVVFYPFQFYVFKNVYKHLAEEAEFIVDMGPFYPVEQPENLKVNIIKLLVEHKVFFRILSYEDYSSRRYLEDFFSSNKCLVSLWFQGCLRLKCNASKLKVHLTYGAGKEIETYALWKSAFDLILAYGKHDSQYFSLLTQCKVAGNPKFDDFFNDNLDTKLLEKLRHKINVSKKTILYLPTHGDLSSINELAEQLKNLSEKYNVFAKLHYFNNYEEQQKVERLKAGDINIFGDDSDLITLLKITDVVVSDNSSAIFDAILADKPLVVTDFLSINYLGEEHNKIRSSRRGVLKELTYSGSIEQKIKKSNAVVTMKKPSDLGKSIEYALRDLPFRREARKIWRESIFDFNDGKCGYRAAEAIRHLLSINNLPERPILYHMILAHEITVATRGMVVRWHDDLRRGIGSDKSKYGIFQRRGKVNRSRLSSIMGKIYTFLLKK